jgi:hypothetical protein
MKAIAPPIKILTFESWLTTDKAFDYALRHPELVPHLLVDRSPCSDPFFDPFSPSDSARQAVIGGLCRGFVPAEGTELLYITKLSRTAVKALGRTEKVRYLAAAYLVVNEVVADHDLACKRFSPSHYVYRDRLTIRPPNVIGADQSAVAMPRESCLIRPDGKTMYTPKDLQSVEAYLPNIEEYVRRSKGEGFRGERVRRPMRVAICSVEKLSLDWKLAPFFDPACLSPDSKGRRILNQNGRWGNRQAVLASIGWL